jgi:hypothetical protein
MAARPGAGGRVRFNVGGQAFETTTTTLANAGRDSMLGALLDSSWNAPEAPRQPAEYFIDRNPACFAVLLDLLRTGSLHVPPHLPEKLPGGALLRPPRPRPRRLNRLSLLITQFKPGQPLLNRL